MYLGDGSLRNFLLGLFAAICLAFFLLGFAIGRFL